MIEIVYLTGYCYTSEYTDMTMETWGSPLYLHMDKPDVSVGGLFMDVRSEKYGNGLFLFIFFHMCHRLRHSSAHEKASDILIIAPTKCDTRVSQNVNIKFFAHFYIRVTLVTQQPKKCV